MCDEKLTAEIDGLRHTAREIIALGDTTDAAVTGSADSVFASVTGPMLAGFALNDPLSRVPETLTHASHTLAGRFFVLGDLMDYAAERLRTSDEAAASSIATAGDLNDAGAKAR